MFWGLAPGQGFALICSRAEPGPGAKLPAIITTNGEAKPRLTSGGEAAAADKMTFKATRDEFVINVWQRIAKDVVGVADLDLIGDAVIKSLGIRMSPASIARVVADHGARLCHSEILQADARWRERHVFEFFAPDEFACDNLRAASTLIEKIEHLRREFASDEASLERLRQAVLRLKTELELQGASKKVTNRHFASEVAQWLTVWLQNPQIFAEWLELRRATAEFQQRFTS
jgi:hypothetical protein